MRTKRTIAVLGALLAVGVAGFVLLPRNSSPKSAALADREQALEMLGTRIAQLRPGCKVLVLANPFTKEASFLSESAKYDRANLRGLRKGLGSRSPVKVVFPEIRPEYLANPESFLVPPDSRTPLCYIIQLESVEKLAEANPECRVIVSFIGLPMGVDRLTIWNESDPHCFALLFPDLRHLGPPGEAAAAFKKGKLLAAVVEDLASGASVVVSQENAGDVLEKQPKVFGY